ncbi:MAG: PAS domain S-box protein [Desulfobacterales bacterium]|jgi:PAS domain S-box-containing protein
MVSNASKSKSAGKLKPSTNTNRALDFAKEALREVEEKCRAIIANIEDGYYEVDLEGHFTDFNDAMSRITGRSRRELMGMNARKIMDEYHARQAFEVFEKVYYTEMPAKAVDWELIRKSGSKRIVEVSVSLKRDMDSRPVGFLGIARDITHRRMIEQALRDSEEKYRTIIENIEDGYYEVDLAGNFTFFNDAMAKITGYTRDELMGMNNRRIMDEYTARQVYEVFNTVYQTGMATKAFDWELITKDGSRRIIEVSVTLRKDLNANPAGFMGIARDITDRRRYVEILEAREKELENKTRDLEELNTALKVLLERRERDKTEIEETVINNVNDIVMPFLERAKAKAAGKQLLDYLTVLEHNLQQITSSFFHKLSTRYANLTTTEIEVANLVKNGKSIKEIADMLNVSAKTVEVHRMNIRKKMGIANTKTSLRTHLLSLG